MQNELLYDRNLREELTREIDLFNILGDLSTIPKLTTITGFATIAEVAEMYGTKIQIITDILKEHLQEFTYDGYRQYSQNEIVRIYTEPFIELKENVRIKPYRNFIAVVYKDNPSIQVPKYGRKLLPIKSILRIACFLEGSSMARYIREIFLENYCLQESQDKIIKEKIEKVYLDMLSQGLEHNLGNIIVKRIHLFK